MATVSVSLLSFNRKYAWVTQLIIPLSVNKEAIELKTWLTPTVPSICRQAWQMPPAINKVIRELKPGLHLAGFTIQDCAITAICLVYEISLDVINQVHGRPTNLYSLFQQHRLLGQLGHSWPSDSGSLAWDSAYSNRLFSELRSYVL